MIPEATARVASSDGEAASRAIYAFERNLVLAASAGTGKTHALVGVAVHLLVGCCRAKTGGLRDPIAPEALVATTFSRKAAAEIRARLAEELGRLAANDPRAQYRKDLDHACLDAGVPLLGDVELARRARVALRGLGRARIGTLHSFAGSVARAHALVLGLSPDFDLPDADTTRERAVRSIERVLGQWAPANELELLLELSAGVDGLVSLVLDLLARIAEDGKSASALTLAVGDAASLDLTFHRAIALAGQLLTDKRLGDRARVLLAAFAGGEPALVEIAMGQLWAVAKQGKQSSVAEEFYELRDRSLPSSGSMNLDDRGRAFVRLWRASDRIHPLGQALKKLLVECEAEIARDNAADSVLGFADLLRAARDVLRDHPEVARGVSSGLQALLVDEFQDTSGLQRDLVQLLWEKHDEAALRRPGVVPKPGDLRAEGLLLVGDRKQSIYGFRGADVAVFAELTVGLAGSAAREALAIPKGRVWEPEEPTADFIPLKHNRRGQPELLLFANALSRLSLVPASSSAELYEIEYVPATEDLLPPSPTLADESAGAHAPRTWWLRVPVTSHATRRSSLQREAEVMASRISAIVRGGALTVRGAPAQWRDIAVLGHRHEALAATAYALARAGIPHVVAGMGFYGAREVKDVVAMLACLVERDDSLSRAEVLRGPWAGVTDRTLIGLTEKHAGLADIARWATGERRFLIDPIDRAAVQALGRVIATLRPLVGRLGPGPSLREACRALQLEETLTLLPRGEQRVANVRKLLAIADDAADGAELLRRLRRAAEREQKEGEAAAFAEEDDAVRLLTVHASKGLAFPIVFIPEVGASAAGGGGPPDPALVETGLAGRESRLVIRVPDAQGALYDTPSYVEVKEELARREAAERRRLRYVAVTRASEALFFVGDRAVSKQPVSYHSSTASFLATLSRDEASCESAQLTVETGGWPPPLEARVDAPAALAPAPHRRLPVAKLPTGPLLVRAEALHEASSCLRRFQLAEVFPPSSLFPRTEAAVRERLGGLGAWGARLAAERPRVSLGEPVVLVVEPPGLQPQPGLAPVLVHATVDARVSWADGSHDLVRFRRSREPLTPDNEARERLFADVLIHGSRAAGIDGSLRAGAAAEANAPDSGDPRWVEPRDLLGACDAIRDLVARLLPLLPLDRAHLALLAARVPEAVCLSTACPHVTSCYGQPGDPTPAVGAGARQTAFGFFDDDGGGGARGRKRRR